MKCLSKVLLLFICISAFAECVSIASNLFDSVVSCFEGSSSPRFDSLLLPNDAEELTDDESSYFSPPDPLPEVFQSMPRKRLIELAKFYFLKSTEEPFEKFLKIKRGRPENKLEWLFVMYFYALKFDDQVIHLQPEDFKNLRLMSILAFFPHGWDRTVGEVYMEGLCHMAEEDEEYASVFEGLVDLLPQSWFKIYPSPACFPVCLIKRLNGRIIHDELKGYLNHAIRNPFVSDEDILSMGIVDLCNQVPDYTFDFLKASFKCDRTSLFKNLFSASTDDWELRSEEEVATIAFQLFHSFSEILSSQPQQLKPEQEELIIYVLDQVRMHSLQAIEALSVYLINFNAAHDFHPRIFEMCLATRVNISSRRSLF